MSGWSSLIQVSIKAVYYQFFPEFFWLSRILLQSKKIWYFMLFLHKKQSFFAVFFWIFSRLFLNHWKIFYTNCITTNINLWIKRNRSNWMQKNKTIAHQWFKFCLNWLFLAGCWILRKQNITFFLCDAINFKVMSESTLLGFLFF